MKHISLEQLEQWRKAGKAFQLIDVREPDEHGAFNIGGELLPLSQLTGAAGRLADDRPVVVYCKRGIRSQIAIQRWLARRPDVDFYNLSGGIGDKRY